MVGFLISWGFPLWIHSEWAGIMIHGAWLLKRAEEEAGKGGIPLSSLCNLPNLPLGCEWMGVQRMVPIPVLSHLVASDSFDTDSKNSRTSAPPGVGECLEGVLHLGRDDAVVL